MEDQIKNVRQNGARLVIGPVRLAYVHLDEPYNPDGLKDGGKYCATPLIPKGDARAVEAVKAAVKAAAQEALAKKWQGSKPSKDFSPLRDGDEAVDKKGDAFAGMLYFNAKSSRRPHVVDRGMSPLAGADELYSGIWAVVGVTFYGYSTGGNKGVGVALDNVMKVADGERMGGCSNAASDFAGLELDAPAPAAGDALMDFDL